MSPCGPEKLSKIISNYLRGLNAPRTLYAPCGPERNPPKNIEKYLRCINAMGILYVPVRPEKKF